MAASDHLSPQQFYHGSPHSFSVGDLVEPGKKSQWRESVPGKVYFTDDPQEALSYGSNPVKPRPVSVYTVEPTGAYDPDSHFHKGIIGTPNPKDVRGTVALPKGKLSYSYESNAPLRVTGVLDDLGK
jgi:Rifampin ADP-ribosyl transferase